MWWHCSSSRVGFTNRLSRLKLRASEKMKGLITNNEDPFFLLCTDIFSENRTFEDVQTFFLHFQSVRSNSLGPLIVQIRPWVVELPALLPRVCNSRPKLSNTFLCLRKRRLNLISHLGPNYHGGLVQWFPTAGLHKCFCCREYLHSTNHARQLLISRLNYNRANKSIGCLVCPSSYWNGNTHAFPANVIFILQVCPSIDINV